MTATLSPSVHEMTVARHMKDDTDDPVMRAMFESVKLTREECTRAAATTQAVMDNPLKTEAQRHQQARDAGFQLLDRASRAIDAALKKADDEIRALQDRVKGPPAAREQLTEMRQQELRSRLTQLTADKRIEIVNDAIKNDNDLIVGAVLNQPAFVSGLDETDLGMMRHNWALRKHAPELDRLERIRKARIDVQRAGTLALSFVDALTDAELIADAEAKAKAATAALLAAKKGNA
jgi:hypothetical protein